MISRLSKFIVISEDTQFRASAYGNLISILSCNDNIPVIPKLGGLLQESLGTKDFPVVMNSIVEHLEKNYVIQEFKVRRRTVAQKVRKKDPNKSRIAKMTWKKNKGTMLKGLRKFHKSTKGKSFHKALGKFASKTTSSNENEDNLIAALLELNELRISISSAMTYLFIDMKQHPNNYDDFPSEDFSGLMDVYSEVMKDLQDALISQDLEIIRDVMNEVIAEFASVLIGTEMEYIYLDDGLTS